MATPTHAIEMEIAGNEPRVRTISRVLPNLRNPVVAAEYKRQRAVIHDAEPAQREEAEFWEAAQSHEGWV